MSQVTYANQLDRLINPYIEALLSHGANYSADFGPEIVAEPQVGFGSNDLNVHRSGKKTTVTWHKVEVYRRVGDNTQLCRPGDWVLRLFELSQESRAKREEADIRKALREAIVRGDSFSPLPGGTFTATAYFNGKPVSV